MLNITENGHIELFNPIETMEASEVGEIVILVTLILSIVVGLSGNLLIVIVRLLKQIQRKNTTAYTFFISQLAIADMAFAFTLVFDAASKFNSERWILNLFMCKFIKILQSTSLATTALFLTLMAYERYCGISKPLHHHWSIRKSTMLVIAIWVFIFITLIPFLLAVNIDENGYCYDINYSSEHFRKVYSLFLFFTNFFLPLICIVVCHTLIIRKMKKHFKSIASSKYRKNGGREREVTSSVSSNTEEENNNNRDEKQKIKKCTDPNGKPNCCGCIKYLNCKQKRKRNFLEPSAALLPKDKESSVKNRSSKFLRVLPMRKRPKNREDRKLVQMLVAVTICFAIMIAPNQFFYIWFDFSDQRNPTVLHLLEVFGSFVYLHCCVNPIIYSAMDKRFRREVVATFKDILKCNKDNDLKRYRFTPTFIPLRVSRNTTSTSMLKAIDDEQNPSELCNEVFVERETVLL